MPDYPDSADLCVKCGMCLPYCPTYGLSGNENESPRGRIALIQAFSQGQLEASSALHSHIDHCLLCRACEQICPVGVPYGSLIDRFRADTRRLGREYRMDVSLLNLLALRRDLRDRVRNGLRFFEKHLNILRSIMPITRLLPSNDDDPAVLQDFYAAYGDIKGEIALFTGCLGEWLDRATLKAAIRCLNAAGFHVRIPRDQTCCGALARHGGDAATADSLEKNNARAFDAGSGLQPIVTVASGCGAHLREYATPGFAGRVTDISQFLAQEADFSKRIDPLPATAVLHTPCSLRNVMHEESGALALLRQIPELRVIKLSSVPECCGAAGSYVLRFPSTANALLSPLLEQGQKAAPDYWLTSNFGCALHIAAGLRGRGIDIKVLHPVTLLARQLR